MPISAQVICDSLSPQGKRITTLVIELPKPYLAEFNTHRQLSRSFMSSRAVPVSTFLKRVQKEPYMPIHWGANQRGMSAQEECNNLVDCGSGNIGTREVAWLDGRDIALDLAYAFSEAGYHKQIVNRLLEPFSYTVGVVTATEWENFFNLRLHPAAQPEMQELARKMKEVMDGSTPQELEPGEWHLPFVDLELDSLTGGEAIALYWEKLAGIHGSEIPDHKLLELGKKVSVARCARVSYGVNQRQVSHTIAEDLALYEGLLKEGHYSPFEHQACPMKDLVNLGEPPTYWEKGVTHMDRNQHNWSGNFQGFIQYRQLLQSSL